ncbi:hypothetical protein HMPREF1395_00093 [Helicobacter pylori GAM112Ai]|nr:hypothetical protein HMPREF1395_00093 [Helicobacter pylori GAM112Ai]
MFGESQKFKLNKDYQQTDYPNVSHGTISKKSVLFKIHGAFVIIVFIQF